ncbi:3-isopropylmalate dehydrogenase [Bosea caraganae]|uniref:3-isopropylmalate dehydrogenase n=1 Tax=Bosea caraganae TaxID=2763117 RepID=A0A370L074_9HYPH|nr:3-isopropylmalate dehydrogenase [Bosea caraganae]RDJ20631.1 3-isopropylmalate dehydrogenase [Bosea caraganae]RDJ28908.1 3-isopropylmalate dehydrogenase [Bosea caraganae]
MAQEARRNRLVVLTGDGVGPELTREMLRVVGWFAAHRGFDCEIIDEPYGVPAYRSHGRMIREEVLAELPKADAVVLGALGSARDYAGIPPEVRKQGTALKLRQQLDAVVNLRPVKASPHLDDVSPLKPEIVRNADLLFVRELTAGLYIDGPRGIEIGADGARRAVNTQVFTSTQIRRGAGIAFDIARQRGRRVTSVDKANVLESGILWREEVQALRDASYPDCGLDHIFVDTCATELVRAPTQFEILLTDNMFGDILSDCAMMIAASPGMLPSASVGERLPDGRRKGFYEPLHGSAPELVGRGEANPLGTILSFAMALDLSFGRPEDAALLERAVDLVLARGNRTPDIAGPGAATISTAEMTAAVLDALATLSETPAT